MGALGLDVGVALASLLPVLGGAISMFCTQCETIIILAPSVWAPAGAENRTPWCVLRG